MHSVCKKTCTSRHLHLVLTDLDAFCEDCDELKKTTKQAYVDKKCLFHHQKHLKCNSFHIKDKKQKIHKQIFHISIVTWRCKISMVTKCRRKLDKKIFLISNMVTFCLIIAKVKKNCENMNYHLDCWSVILSLLSIGGLKLLLHLLMFFGLKASWLALLRCLMPACLL